MLVAGANVNAFLSRNIRRVGAWDGLLWHYGMHHFHLGSEIDAEGFVQRSDHLLFAIIAPQDSYFVDVRPHPPARSTEWVRQELLHVVRSNWPQLIEGSVVPGVRAIKLTDEQICRLRQNNINSFIDVDGEAIEPLLLGTLADGSSALCAIRANQLLDDLDHHEEILANDDVRDAVARNLRARGLDPGQAPAFELVFLEVLSPRPEQIAALAADACVSKNLCRMGFAVIERRTGSLVILHSRAST